MCFQCMCLLYDMFIECVKFNWWLIYLSLYAFQIGRPFDLLWVCVYMWQTVWWNCYYIFFSFYSLFFPFNVPVSICMWFRSNPTNADVLYLSDKKRFESSNFNKSNALIVYLHGFSERVPGGAGQSSQEIRDGMWRAKNEKKYLSEFSWNQHIH